MCSPQDAPSIPPTLTLRTVAALSRYVEVRRFSTYDALQLYYVGYGGNTNTTTRFRRYDGTGARPLDPAHDLTTAPYLLQPDHTYTIELIAAGGRAIYRRDGEVIFDYTDPAPLTRGWFGFRTVNSATRISSFEVHRLAKTP